MNLTHALLLGTAFAVPAFFAACGASVSVGVEGQTPTITGAKVGITVTVDPGGNKNLVITPPPSKTGCAQVCFTDASGADLGCTITEVPGSTPVPPGAKEAHITKVDCPEEESSRGSGSSGGGGMFDPFAFAQATQVSGFGQRQPAVPKLLEQWEFYGGTLIPLADGSTNVSYSFNIRAASLAQAKARRDMVLAGGIGTSVGVDFDVVFYNETEAQFDVTGLPTGVRMRQAEVNDDFTTYRLTINGLVFAELGVTGGILHYGTSNGWNVVETFVPTSAFGSNPTSFDNQAEADWADHHAPRSWSSCPRRLLVHLLLHREDQVARARAPGRWRLECKGRSCALLEFGPDGRLRGRGTRNR